METETETGVPLPQYRTLLDAGFTWEEINKLDVLRIWNHDQGHLDAFGFVEIRRLQFMRWLQERSSL